MKRLPAKICTYHIIIIHNHNQNVYLYVTSQYPLPLNLGGPVRGKNKGHNKTHKVTVLFLDVLLEFEFEFSICCSGVQMIVLPNLQNKGVRNRVVVVCGRLREGSEGLGKKLLSGSPFKNRETCFKMRYPEMVWYYNEAFQE